MHKFDALIATRGKDEAVKYFKLSRLAITRTLAGQDLVRPFGISLAKDNLPSFLPKAIREKILAKDYSTISWVLTLLSVSRMQLGDPKSYSTKTITDPFTGVIPMNQASVALVMRRLGVSPLLDMASRKFAFP
jgi:hypothetical protein